MALSFHLAPPQTFLHPFFSSSATLRRTRTLVSCTSRAREADLAPDSAAEIESMNTHLAQRSEAMKRSREILFSELCWYLSSEAEDVKKKWGTMEEEEKWVLIKGFVSEWGVDFHPLSSRSVKELVEEHLGDLKTSSPNPSPPPLFHRLKNMMGFWD